MAHKPRKTPDKADNFIPVPPDQKSAVETPPPIAFTQLFR